MKKKIDQLFCSCLCEMGVFQMVSKRCLLCPFATLCCAVRLRKASRSLCRNLWVTSAAGLSRSLYTVYGTINSASMALVNIGEICENKLMLCLFCLVFLSVHLSIQSSVCPSDWAEAIKLNNIDLDGTWAKNLELWSSLIWVWSYFSLHCVKLRLGGGCIFELSSRIWLLMHESPYANS